MRLSPPAPIAALPRLTTAAPAGAWARRLLPVALLLLPILAGCAGALPSASPEPAPPPGIAAGSTADAIRGTPSLGEPLRPEPGNIWADGLTPSTTSAFSPNPAPLGRPGK